MRDRFLSLASRLYMIADRKPQITVVTCHRVSPSCKIQPEHVERCFKFLAHHFTLVHPSELDFTNDDRRTAIVTVDDGHIDVYRYIFPIAKALGVPLSLCIPTDFFFRGRWLWLDKIKWAMHNASPSATATVNGFEVSTNDPSSFERLKQYLKRSPPELLDTSIQELFYSLDLDLPSSPPEQFRPLSVSELREMLSSGLVEIVGHTVTHTVAAVLDEHDFENEVRQSKQEWELFLGQPIVSFCYPNGEPGDFNHRTKLALQEAGYRFAFTSVEGINRPGAMDPLEMKRVHIREDAAVFTKLAGGLGSLQNYLQSLGRKLHQSSRRTTRGDNN